VDIPKKLIPKVLPKKEPVEIIHEMLSKLSHCPRLIHEPEPSYYLLSEDVIHMPPMDCIGSHEYYALFYKQLISMTQHQTRLGLMELAENGLEELITKIGSWVLAFCYRNRSQATL